MRKRRWLLLAAAALAYVAAMIGVDRVLVYHPAADSIRISDDISVGG